MKAGDNVRVVKIPSGLPDETQRLLERCLGKCFQIQGIESDGRLELFVGSVLGKKNFLHSVYMWPEEVELIKNSN